MELVRSMLLVVCKYIVTILATAYQCNRDEANMPA